MWKESSPAKPKTEKVFSNMSSVAWKKWVTEQRQEYSVRAKSAHPISESECLSWGTPSTMDTLPPRSPEALARAKKKGGCKNLREEVAQWATPNAMEIYKEENQKPWPTPTSRDWKDGSRVPPSRSGAKAYDQTLPQRIAAMNQQKSWPTPTVAEAEKISNKPNYGQLALSNHPEVHGCGVDREKLHKDRKGLAKGSPPDQEKNNTSGNTHEQLAADWVDQLMGLPVGWTQLPIEWIDYA
tara:strand:+ start:818 stop:1537 length:720 start_codon:yes stop_codon:yes gene_type:complete